MLPDTCLTMSAMLLASGSSSAKNCAIVDLRHRLVGLRLQLAQLEQAIVEVVLLDQCAFSMWTR